MKTILKQISLCIRPVTNIVQHIIVSLLHSQSGEDCGSGRGTYGRQCYIQNGHPIWEHMIYAIIPLQQQQQHAITVTFRSNYGHYGMVYSPPDLWNDPEYITATLTLGGNKDVGNGYILTLFELLF